MTVSWFRYFCLITCFYLSSGLSVYAENKAQDTYSIAVNSTSYPYHYINEQGEAAGLTVDLWKLWAKKQQVNVDFKVMTWKETLAKVANGKIDIHAGLAKTEAREKDFLFTPAFFLQDNHFFVHRDYANINTIEKLEPFTIGIVAGSSHIDVIKKIYPNFNLRLYKNRFAIFDAALKGEIVAFANLDKLSRNYPRSRELQLLFPPYNRLKFKQSEYGSAVAKDKVDLMTFIEVGLQKISAQEKSSIEKKWLGVDKKTKVLTLLYSPNNDPYMDISPSGKAQGLFIDMWRLWSTYTGHAIELIPQNEKDSIEILQSGGADIHIAGSGELAVDTDLQLAHYIYNVPAKIYIGEHVGNIGSAQALFGKKLGVLSDSAHINQLKQMYPEINLIQFRDLHMLINAANQGEIDALLAAVESFNSALNLRLLKAKFTPLANIEFNADIYSYVSNGNDKLAEIISEGFKLVPEEELIKLERQWLNNSETGYFKLNQSKVNLTENEATWLEKHNTIRVGVNKSWAPVEYLDDQGQLHGINAEINQFVTTRTGLNFDYISYDSWSEMLEALKRKEVDILGSATETEERKKTLLFTDSYWDMPWVVIHQRHNDAKVVIEDFYGKELAIVKGYHLIAQIREKYPNITIRLVDSHEQGLQAVQQGSVEGLIENIASASELIRRESLIPLNMSVVDDVNVDKNSFAVRKDWPELKQIIDKALATITAAEKQKIYEKWFEIKIETGFDKSVVFRVALQAGVIIVGIIVIIVVWNRRLYVEIQTRKSLELKMKHMATHDELTGLANRVLLKDRITTAINFHQRQSRLMAVLFIDLDGFKTINDTYGHDVGDELLILIADKLSGCVRKSDTVVRFGGDEFVLLLTGLHTKDEAAFIAEKVLKLVQQPFQLSAGEVNIGCSIGIAIYPDDGESDTDLLKVADTLMYKVKAAGKNHYIFNS